MIVIISNPEQIPQEHQIINELFDEGLELFHLRKPNYSKTILVNLLKKINPEHYSKIVLHQHYVLNKYFNINRLHFSESKRLSDFNSGLNLFKTLGFWLSTSVHSINDYEQLPKEFSYAFYGPLFESISKPGYKPASSEIIQIKKKTETKIIAIGGIKPENIRQVMKQGFDGVALLGAVWNNPDNAVEVFRQCRENANM